MTHIPFDYHIHTGLCRHAKGKPADMAAAAVRAGLSEIAITDHIPFGDFDPAHRMASWEVGLYLEEIEAAKVAFPQLTIKTGFEADFFPGSPEQIKMLVGMFPVDLLIGSVHYVDGSLSYIGYCDAAQKRCAHDIEIYFRLCTDMVASGVFDIVGHVDIFNRIGRVPAALYADKMSALLQKVAAAGMALEINTSGYRYEKNGAFPSIDILEQVVELGIPLTFGSDAHIPDEIATSFDRLESDLPCIKKARFATYSRRKPTIVSWDELGMHWKRA